MITPDPFTIVYDAIIAELKKEPAFRVVSWNSIRNPAHDTVSEVDLPEIQLVPSSMIVNLGNKSCGTSVERTLQILANTGDFVLGKLLFPVEWGLLNTAHSLQYGALDNLEFTASDGAKLKFVSDVAVSSAVEGQSDPTNNRGISGWTAIWDIIVYMSFPLGNI